MTVLSDAPKDEPNHCPICNTDVRVEHSVIFGDATCLNCGTLLWFIHSNSELHLFDHALSLPVRDRVIRAVADAMDVTPEELLANPSYLNDVGAVDLIATELILQLEDEHDGQ